ncbi:flagellin N-terminal helical domain-containing protein [Anaerosacchariphilus polymeriproducens]|uniref:Flagellin n=1 Tax=Anaerosacchariphilus polymeriproducens TaxID=1812858 RepID=A0A371AZN6_9FIRM|nr:flagellin [Anaerosacchariphilus polymeriproducens]RDU25068.1 hypothetical protein DWV06_00785 [Anaerosacchariphilus polymeriproducens]
MKINHNMSAIIANRELLKTEDKLTQSLERLSSGLKINHAKDNPAGMAIANKMDAQINGLSKASTNAQDGISVIETAEGALSEVTSIIQRMRELAVQAANGTNTTEDMEAIQKEVDNLSKEIDRISKDTEFNKKTLLDGSLDQKAYIAQTEAKVTYFSNSVSAQEYGLTIVSDARQAVYVGDNSDAGQGNILAAQEGNIYINGVTVSIEEGDNSAVVYEKIRSAAEQADVTLISVSAIPGTIYGTDSDYAGYTPESFTYGNRLVFVSEDYGSKASVQISCDNAALASALGLQTTQTEVRGIDVDAEFTLDAGEYIGYENTAVITSDGMNVTVTDRNGFEMNVKVKPGMAQTVFVDMAGTTPGSVTPGTSEDLIIDVKDIGSMTLQIGANEGQIMEVRIPDMSLEGLELNNLNYSSDAGLEKAITALDKALSKVSSVRSQLGAYQNRLDHAIASLDTSELNMTSALSRIEDVDMAEEMSNYTQYNVLSQAATSVLAQANDKPQQVLQLLQ